MDSLIIAALITAGVAIVGIFAAGLGWWYRSRHERKVATDAAVAALTIEKIRDTEKVVQAQLASFKAMIVAPTDRHAQAKVRRAEAVAESSLQADMPVIGEIDVVVQLVETYIQVIGKIPAGPFLALWLRPLLWLRNPWNQDDVDALENARTACLKALQRQEERVRCGEPLATYTREELAGRVDLDLMESITDRLTGRDRK
ncbi:MAG TPA: hypothetical protein VGE81_06705 [Candidatus Limnocylindrales bacterium]